MKDTKRGRLLKTAPFLILIRDSFVVNREEFTPDSVSQVGPFALRPHREQSRQTWKGLSCGRR